MTLLNARAPLAVLLVAALLGANSTAGTISLGSFAGTTVDFNNLVENNGLASPAPFPSLYAPVSVSGDTLTFGTAAFSLEATTAGFPPSVLDHSISFQVVAKPGETISSVLIQESYFAETMGTGTVQGFYGGPANTLNPASVVSASASAMQTGDGANVIVPAPLLFTFPTPVTQANFTLDNRLTAFKLDQADLARITKGDLTVTVNPVPEPMSATIFACGFAGLLTVRRRRR
tara:strand:+ start:81884 stop:82579 length:696 start_codon:yes stop_codon:yes gene_type:complete